MYRRYAPMSPPPNGGNQFSRPQNSTPKPPQNNAHRSSAHRQTRPGHSAPPPVTVRENHENKKNHRDRKSPRSMLFGLIPPSLYDPKSKKILGFLNSEDLLLVALIFLFLEREDEDQTMILVLLYLLLSDHIDLPFEF